jgi:hypothetical protein
MSKRDVPRGQPKFSITDHRGTQITFANGVRISIQWGPGNYCADYWDRSYPMDYDAPKTAERWDSPDAEVALFWANGQGEWLTKEAHAALNNGADAGDVLPALAPDEVARYIAWAAARAPREAKP